MPSLGPPELILILVIVLILFGPGKLTGLGTSLGKSIKEFRKATSEPDEEEEKAEEAKPVASKTVVEETKVARRPTVTVTEEHVETVEATDRESK